MNALEHEFTANRANTISIKSLAFFSNSPAKETTKLVPSPIYIQNVTLQIPKKYLLLLHLSCLDNHLGGRVNDLHLLYNGRSIACYKKLVNVVDNELEHAYREGMRPVRTEDKET